MTTPPTPQETMEKNYTTVGALKMGVKKEVTKEEYIELSKFCYSIYKDCCTMREALVEIENSPWGHRTEAQKALSQVSDYPKAV